MMTLYEQLRAASERPDNWDVPGLLGDAADVIRRFTELAKQTDDPRVQRIVTQVTDGANLYDRD